MMRGRCIVVGGHSRGVGKTALVVDLVRALRPGPVVTVKVSAHRHGAAVAVEEHEHDAPPTASSTGRCLAAGAARALLCRCPDDQLALARALVESLQGSGAHVVVESNRMARWLQPDLTCFVVSAGTTDWKASSDDCLASADAVVLAPGTASPPPRVTPYLASRGGRAAVLTFSTAWHVPALREWVAQRLEPAAIAV